MKRPPDRKLQLAVALLIVAASVMLSRAAGPADPYKGEFATMNRIVPLGGR